MYEWVNLDAPGVVISTSQTVTGLPEGEYAISVFNNDGTCPTTITGIQIISIIGPNINSDLTTPEICGGLDGTVTVIVNGGVPPYTFAWENESAPGIIVSNDPLVTGLATGTYAVTVANDDGSCPSIYSGIQVGSVGGPDIIDFEEINEECMNGMGEISVQVTNGVPPYLYIWENAASPGVIISNEGTLDSLSAGNYNVTITNSDGTCPTVGMASISNFNESFFADFAVEPPTCFGDEDAIIFLDTLYGPEDNYTYSLDGGPAVIAPIFADLGAGGYEITIYNSDGCNNTQTIVITEPEPVTVDAGQDTTILFGDSILLTPEVTGNNLVFDWNPDMFINCTDCQIPLVQPAYDLLYEITVTDTLTGCSAMDNVMVFIENPKKIYVPNTFTPNGDKINDVLAVFGGNSVVQINFFRVFDRWGEQVYQAEAFEPNDPTFGWDGTFRGKKMNPAVFTYVIDVEFTDGSIERYWGDITLIR